MVIFTEIIIHNFPVVHVTNILAADILYKKYDK